MVDIFLLTWHHTRFGNDDLFLVAHISTWLLCACKLLCERRVCLFISRNSALGGYQLKGHSAVLLRVVVELLLDVATCCWSWHVELRAHLWEIQPWRFSVLSPKLQRCFSSMLLTLLVVDMIRMNSFVVVTLRYGSYASVHNRIHTNSTTINDERILMWTNFTQVLWIRQYTKVDVGGCSSMCEGAFSCAITPWNICVKKSHNIYTAKILPRECVTYLSEVFVSRTCSELPKAVRIDQRLMFQNMTLLSWHRSVFQCYNTKSLILVKYIKVHWQMCILVFKINK